MEGLRISSQIAALFILSFSICHRPVIAVIPASDSTRQLVLTVPCIAPPSLRSQKEVPFAIQVLAAFDIAEVDEDTRLHGVGD